MHIPRILLRNQLATGNILVLDEQPAHHVRRVLRLRTGDTLRLFDGQGTEHEAILHSINRKQVKVEIGGKIVSAAEPPHAITLAQGIPRGDRMDFTLQKAVELGISAIQPVWVQRSRKKLDDTRMQKRLRHWQGVLVNACEQSGRATLPELLAPADYRSWLDSGQTDGLYIMLHPDGDYTLPELERPRGRIVLLVGPEGGISNEEMALATRSGFFSVRLGPRILRTETAAMAALAGIQALWGDFRSN
ncbi:MAG: 16S rRNA (uracil(1498)-N(3))-methyltransferase [Halobacteria archaeon]|nr:16S rRNA (uracil(1498)-N(3))-methyltransferase [Halobacteria archaeon]